MVWVHGNHDADIGLVDADRILFVPSYNIGRRLYIAHGHAFDLLKPHGLPFIYLFRAFHLVRVALGAEAVHVALYAKRFPRLYGVLRRHVAARATAYAARHGYAAVACGHTHFAEDSVVNGIRYLNTGSLTERPAHQIVVTERELVLEQVPAG